ncbi:hypothetical protein OG440_41045 (plasmid) [Streptomyces sp. NBC_00637]|uniref:DUF6059 family protein n=1 Tax=Streptomyces sp. NBC_00637 TaxID=2903667 RepID=UPI002F9114B9
MPHPAFLRSCYEALTAFGWLLIGVAAPPDDRPPLIGPAPLHPERLCPERPLTALERALDRQLAG